MARLTWRGVLGEASERRRPPAPERPLPGTVRVHDLGDAGPVPETSVYLDGFCVFADRDKLHQTVKPLVLTDRLVTVAPAGGIVVAPFPPRVACYRLTT